MSSDSEISPSPMCPSEFVRGSPARGTVARKCREFYIRRLERTATMQKRWSLCEIASPATETELQARDTDAQDSLNSESENGPTVDNVDMDVRPLRKCRSSLDIAMDSLRKEISSLIAQDNDLFKQLLSLHDSIAELRERQRYSLYPDDDDDDNVEEEEDRAADGDREDSPSLESLSDNGDLAETSPESTLSCRSSSLSSDSVHYHHHHNHKHSSAPNRNRHRLEVTKKRHRAATVGNDEPRPLIFVDKSEICFRCRKMAPPYRRARSITNFYWCNEDMDSYDSGIHLQGSHSDSDHEIFV